MSEKKVVAVIVEGLSDESALGGVLKEFFSSEEVQFAVVHGDITSDDLTTTDNIVTRIDELINGIRNKYGYRWEDFVKVIHIVDTDGAFTRDCVVESNVNKTQYFEDHIEAANVDAIKRRNRNKFNSCNLEHVLYGVLKDFTDDEKMEMSDAFAERYEGKADEFIAFVSDGKIAVSGAYRDTWKFIEKGKHSLERHSNMHLIFV